VRDAGAGDQFHHGIEIGAELDKPQAGPAGQAALDCGLGNAG
jgi:hypothetical protein